MPFKNETHELAQPRSLDLLFLETGDSMTKTSRSAFGYALLAALLGGILSIAALIIVISQSGYGQPSTVCIVLVYLAYWPVLLVGWSAHELFVSFWVILMNVVAWGLAGLLVGMIRQVLGRRNKQTNRP